MQWQKTLLGCGLAILGLVLVTGCSPPVESLSSSSLAAVDVGSRDSDTDVGLPSSTCPLPGPCCSGISPSVTVAAWSSPNVTSTIPYADPLEFKRRVVKPQVPATKAPHPVKRIGSVVGLNRETVEEYMLLHAHVWPEVLDRIRRSNIRNYSIHMGELDTDDLYLFSYFEYIGDDFEADMQAIADDPVTRDWWKLTDPLQRRVRHTPEGDQWKRLKEVFHTE